MLNSIKLIATAVASFTVGMSGTYIATAHTTVICPITTNSPTAGIPPTHDLPLTGWQRY